jgi:hypothetical protein
MKQGLPSVELNVQEYAPVREQGFRFSDSLTGVRSDGPCSAPIAL